MAAKRLVRASYGYSRDARMSFVSLSSTWLFQSVTISFTSFSASLAESAFRSTSTIEPWIAPAFT